MNLVIKELYLHLHIKERVNITNELLNDNIDKTNKVRITNIAFIIAR
jgi:hypothetical protein